MSRRALLIWLSVKRCRRPPRFLPAALRLDTESLMRSRLISGSICAKAAVTVNTMHPGGSV
jgi:hypothetical protein